MRKEAGEKISPARIQSQLHALRGEGKVMEGELPPELRVREHIHRRVRRRHVARAGGRNEEGRGGCERPRWAARMRTNAQK